jgi:hypothetical protein
MNGGSDPFALEGKVVARISKKNGTNKNKLSDSSFISTLGRNGAQLYDTCVSVSICGNRMTGYVKMVSWDSCQITEHKWLLVSHTRGVDSTQIYCESQILALLYLGSLAEFDQNIGFMQPYN